MFISLSINKLLELIVFYFIFFISCNNGKQQKFWFIITGILRCY